MLGVILGPMTGDCSDWQRCGWQWQLTSKETKTDATCSYIVYYIATGYFQYEEWQYDIWTSCLYK